jgi:hypothetical protein
MQTGASPVSLSPAGQFSERVQCPTPEMFENIEENVRKRQEREEVVFKKWLKTRERD